MISLLLIVLHLLLFAPHFFLLGDLHALARFEVARGQQLVKVVKVQHLSIFVHDCY